MKKLLVALILLLTPAVAVAQEQFSRPGIPSDPGSGQYSHVQLANPADSGVKVIVDFSEITRCTNLTIGTIGSGTLASGASFPESRGLPLDPVDTYAKAHVRIMTGSAVNMGQLDNMSLSGTPLILTKRYVLNPDQSLWYRCSSGMTVTPNWHEVPYP